METTPFPFSRKASFEADVKTVKAFQVDDSEAQLKIQNEDTPNTDATKNAIKLEKMCSVEETDQGELGLSNFEGCEKGFNLSINLRENSQQTTGTFPGGECSRQSSFIDLKEGNSTLQEGIEYIVGKRELAKSQAELEKETRKRPNAENEGERKFCEQPQALLEDEIVKLAISQKKEDFVQKTIHTKEHQAYYDDDFVSLRPTHCKGPTQVVLGRGTFAKCFLEEKYDQNSGKTVNVARKEIENKTNNTEDERRKEYLMMKRLKHQNIVQCLDDSIDRETKKYSIIMEYMPGENLLLCESFQVLKICDFGLSTSVDCIDTGYTDTHAVGTVPFMAPEIVSGQCYSAASDVWSVGCCIIQMATGKLPWNANCIEEMAVFYKIGIAKDPPPIPGCLSPALQNLTRHCLFIDKKKRLSAEQLLNRFQKALLPKCERSRGQPGNI